MVKWLWSQDKENNNKNGPRIAINRSGRNLRTSVNYHLQSALSKNRPNLFTVYPVVTRPYIPYISRNSHYHR